MSTIHTTPHPPLHLLLGHHWGQLDLDYRILTIYITDATNSSIHFVQKLKDFLVGHNSYTFLFRTTSWYYAQQCSAMTNYIYESLLSVLPIIATQYISFLVSPEDRLKSTSESISFQICCYLWITLLAPEQISNSNGYSDPNTQAIRTDAMEVTEGSTDPSWSNKSSHKVVICIARFQLNISQ